MIVQKVGRQWRLAVHGNERGSPTDLLVVNSIDDDPKSARVSLAELGQSTIVPVSDLIELLKRIEHLTKPGGRGVSEPSYLLDGCGSGVVRDLCERYHGYGSVREQQHLRVRGVGGRGCRRRVRLATAPARVRAERSPRRRRPIMSTLSHGGGPPRGTTPATHLQAA